MFFKACRVPQSKRCPIILISC